jgi:uncharacterized protein (TIGR00369 family)
VPDDASLSAALPYRDADPEVLAEMLARFKATPLHALLGLDIRPPDPDQPGVTVVDMPLAPGAFSSTGNLHGGAIATLLDVACASAASRSSSFVPGENTIVTADVHVRYLGRPKGAVVRAEARVTKSGRTLSVVEGRVIDDQDTLLAVADFSSMVVPLRQPLMPDLRTDDHAPEM